ncbi:Rieske 2Fe-2S domain-containing protein [Uliginosibacterium aquaticum]|uniref:Rieske 2Fe-2S domain-containing protein n=1 Tax=Uliginosibacterium aquaticum TaxID=2731212 RepID=UPI001C2D8E54|nr:Rieske 2Fe-2S domain-containing protein [Uliginosibacterium aquaticum]
MEQNESLIQEGRGVSYQTLCKKSMLFPGEMLPCKLGSTEIVVLWPERGRPRAFDARCPHEDVSLLQGVFEGNMLICSAHGWVFDSHSGEGLSPTGCELREYPIRVAGEHIEVDLDDEGAEPA